jgi:hypothetical protein
VFMLDMRVSGGNGVGSHKSKGLAWLVALTSKGIILCNTHSIYMVLSIHWLIANFFLLGHCWTVTL